MDFVIWLLAFTSRVVAARPAANPDPASQTTAAAREVSRVHPVDAAAELRTGLAFLHSQQWDVARSHLRLAAESDPNVRKQLADLGREAFRETHFDEALTLVNSVIEFVPDAAPLHSIAGACYYNLRNPALAAREIQQSIRLNPENEDYYIQLAQVFIDYNTPEPCILLLKPALRRFPSSARIRFVLGVAYLKSSQFEQARQSLKESLRMRPRDPLALHALAMASEAAEDWKGLLETAQTMQTLHAQEDQSCYYQAEAYYSLYRGRPERRREIEEVLRRSLALNPHFAESQILMGKLELDDGSYRAAVESFKRATAIEPHLAAAYYNLAIAYQRLGDNAQSSEAFKQFQKVTQNNKDSEKSLRYEVVGNPGQSN
jgi:tetratricopeptide (TPR) repeat protein